MTGEMCALGAGTRVGKLGVQHELVQLRREGEGSLVSSSYYLSVQLAQTRQLLLG